MIKDLPQRHRLHKGTLKFLALSGAILALNACLSFHNIWPTPWIRLQPEISIEALVIILLISLGSSRGLLEKTAGRLTLVSILIFLIIGRYIDVTAPSLYGRPVNLYWDLQHIPGVAAMLIAGPGSWAQAFALTLAPSGRRPGGGRTINPFPARKIRERAP